ncbi:nucleotide exchange factor GrpE [Clostridium neuense]|uniref:Nucleotide exchange factor GrpE n=1 Tax=Clostridium neuense TaxID=1728934 RepID=A0ABW8TBL4_9CLOT
MCDKVEDENVEESTNEEVNIVEIVEKINQSIQEVKEEFDSKVKYDRHKDKIIDELHEELQEYKDDIIHKLLRPVITDIIYTIDNNNKTVQALKQKNLAEIEPEKLIGIIEGQSEDLEDILYRQGVEEFTYVMPEFDPKKQKIVKTVETDEKDKDRTIAKSLRKGYMFEDRVIRHELVEVYVYKEQK